MNEVLHISESSSPKKYDLHRVTVLSWIPPSLLFLMGVAVCIPFMLTNSLLIRAIQVSMSLILALQVKHVRIWYFLMITTTIMIFYVLVPNGKILYELGFIRITEGALREGVFRSLTLNGYVFLSLWCVSTRLSLPTKYGRMLALTVQYFNILLQSAMNNKYRDAVRSYDFGENNAKKKNATYRLVNHTDTLLLDAMTTIQNFEYLSNITKIQVSIYKKLYAVFWISTMITLGIWDVIVF